MNPQVRQFFADVLSHLFLESVAELREKEDRIERDESDALVRDHSWRSERRQSQ